MNEIIAAAKCRRGAWNGYSLLKSEWNHIIRIEIRRAKLKPMERSFMLFQWQERNQRRDPDGFSGAGRKFILDALVNGGILKSDGWAHIMGFQDTFTVNKDQPGVWVTLK